MKIENIIGKPVQNQNFFGRDAELEELQAISELEHVLLLAPRRVGKTSLLQALVKRVYGDGSAIGVDGRWRFRSGLLRRYWLRHVV